MIIRYACINNQTRYFEQLATRAAFRDWLLCRKLQHTAHELPPNAVNMAAGVVAFGAEQLDKIGAEAGFECDICFFLLPT